MKTISQQGAISIVLATLLLITLVIISVGISALVVRQIRMSGQIEYSVIAYYAAEAGAERCLYGVRQQGASTCSSGSLDNGATYQASYTSSTPDHIITSAGQYSGVSRKLELSWQE
jgi:Tfp pilus assembly protein PilX